MIEKYILSAFIALVLVSVLNCNTVGGPTHGKEVVCYVLPWAIDRKGDGKFKSKDLDGSLCTQVVYLFAGLDENTTTIRSTNPELDLGDKNKFAGYRALTNLKNQYPHLKVLVSVGTWDEGSLRYSNMAASSEKRATFIESVLKFIEEYNFDGIEMQWKYPATRGGKPVDKANFVTLMKELKEAFQPRGYMLTTVLSALRSNIYKSYDIPKLNLYVDQFLLTSYGYHGKWDGVVGANAPLRGYDEDDSNSVENTLEYLLSKGINPNKLILGLPLFGRTFILQDPKEENIEFGKTLVKNESFNGPYNYESGIMAYNEICRELSKKDSPWTYYWDERSSTPYLRDGARVISYDNVRSIVIKIKKAMAYNLAGVQVWSIDMDDFKGSCDKEIKYVSISTSSIQEFIQKYNRIANNPILDQILEKLNLPDLTSIRLNPNRIANEIIYRKNHLWQAESQTSNYVMMRTIDDSLTLALEEKATVDNMINSVDGETKTFYPNITVNEPKTMMCYYCYL